MTINQRIQYLESLIKEIRITANELEADKARLEKKLAKLRKMNLTNKQAAGVLDYSPGHVSRLKSQGLLKSTNLLDVLEYAP